MKTVIDIEDLKRMINGAIAQIRAQHAYLSSLDAAIGDGDHGTTILRGMNNLANVLETTSASDLKSLLSELGWSFLGVDGGASGPLLGSFLLGMSEAVGEQMTLDCRAFAAMFAGGLASIQQQTRAKAGDKTLLDALIPAVEALHNAAAAGDSILTALQSAVNAAEAGAFATKELQARMGRAKNLRERAIGHQDPGATSIALIFRGFLEGLSQPPQ
ncbi:MAG: dihydroxyacetone kinase subunit DhaL [Candidatus Vecturithrix sp.]|jgi:dihydroxyacetone kinase-like protein|nr:dihydroxyacetone kinase subunit DhaL [Candidatus Vecturithrix sp.]